MEGIPGLREHRRTIIKYAQRTRTPRTISPKPPEQTEAVATDHQLIEDVYQSTAGSDGSTGQRSRLVQQRQRRENKELGYKPPPNTSNQHPTTTTTIEPTTEPPFPIVLRLHDQTPNVHHLRTRLLIALHRFRPLHSHDRLLYWRRADRVRANRL